MASLANLNMNKTQYKKLILKRNESLACFNAWERQLSEIPDYAESLAAVFEFYELIPEQARKRPLNVGGIIKMHEGLACLV